MGVAACIPGAPAGGSPEVSPRHELTDRRPLVATVADSAPSAGSGVRPDDDRQRGRGQLRRGLGRMEGVERIGERLSGFEALRGIDSQSNGNEVVVAVAELRNNVEGTGRGSLAWAHMSAMSLVPRNGASPVIDS